MISQEIQSVLQVYKYIYLCFDTELKMHRYRGEYEYQGNLFVHEIRFDEIQNDYLKLPQVFINSLPENIPERMPHFEANNRLCYLDIEGVFLNPFNLKTATIQIIEQVQKTFRETIDRTETQHAEEHAYEFSAYWMSSKTLGLLATREQAGHIYAYERDQLPDRVNVRKFEVYLPKNDLQAKSTWFSELSEFVDPSSISGPENAIYIESNKMPLISPGATWPPQNFSEYLTWYKSVDQGAYTKLLSLIRQNFQKLRLTIFFRFSGDHLIGIKLKKSKIRSMAIDESIRRNSRNSILETLFKSKKSFDTFDRIFVEDTSSDFILKRNAEANLTDRKIALIGAGTIGGYLAHLLVQNGAGFGDGSLSIYDADVFSSGNIGRHILGTKYLFQQKSEAICHFIQSDYHYSHANLRAFKEFDYKKINSLGSFDLLIDATGNRAFSTLLSHQWHKSDKASRPNVLIHSWIDAAGQVARALIDDDCVACYHCIHSNKELVPYKVDVVPKKIRRSCAGSSFFVFSADASMAAAALGLNKAIASLKGSPQPRFSSIPIGRDVKSIRSRDVKKLKGCPCCQI
ncbi:MAG: ThiF family adenylyltransferase [Methyloprofundus sp.]|nr:ThiF family adenylyltransferase [Methyloprofundus sp.]